MRLLHPDMATLLAYEGKGVGSRPEIEKHLTDCERCRQTLDDLNDLRGRARLATEVSPPDDLWARISSRREAGEVVVLPLDGGVSLREQPRMLSLYPSGISLGRAAALLLFVAGLASATLPGSPVREWLAGRRNEAAVGPASPSTVEPPENLGAASSVERAAPAVDRAPPTAGISTTPLLNEVTVSFQAPQPGASLRVQLTDGAEVEILARGEAAGAVFRSGSDRIDILEMGPGEVELALPRRLLRATVDIDGAAILSKVGDEIRIVAPTADTVGGTFVLPLR